MVDLRLGDCLEVMKTIEDNSIDAIITDPPYGTTQCKWDSVIPFVPMWEQLNRIIKPNGAIVLFGSEPFSSALRMSNIKNYKYDWVWDKKKAMNFLNAKKQPMKYHEIISVFYNQQCSYYPVKTTGHKLRTSFRKKSHQAEVYGKMDKDNSYQSSERYPKSIQVFSTDTQNSSLHPTQKPVSLIQYLIKTYTKEKETVLDFTMGSGTTMVGCLNLNRNGIGIEKDEAYFKIADKRINEIIAAPKMF